MPLVWRCVASRAYDGRTKTCLRGSGHDSTKLTNYVSRPDIEPYTATVVRIGNTDPCWIASVHLHTSIAGTGAKAAKQASVRALRGLRGQERLNCRASCPQAAADASNKGRSVAKPR